ncbi:hypothetical protein [Croceicoccus gelatinilyticus]|uniref:hypothetical protein n=1 Tax=Croceicoccus gelatinilyticus TaxID=2835536 RepID=UPI001BCDB93B|nr:hypothetical protein [Croceicoccus gelatinilyticus]MBS7668534.1 hypothetical protein [Croceicoccus gelatinilyticus]
MKTNLELIRPAGSAIAAVLALTATNALAQDATSPDIVVPTVPTVTEAAPTTTATTPQIVIPDPTPSQAAAIAPTVQAEPEPTVVAAPVEPVEAAPVADAPAAVTAVPSEPSTRVASVAAADPSPIQQADIAAEAESAGVPVVDDAVESDPALAATSSATAAPLSDPAAGDDTNATLTMAGGAAALGLGFVGLFMAGSARRRRRDRHGTTAAMTDERKTLPLRKEPATVPAAAVAPTAAIPAEPEPAIAQRRQPNVTYGGSKWDDAGYVNASPASAVLPAGEVPRSAEGRRALLERLVRAKPDEAIPFRSPKARRRRARLIVQSLTQRLREQPNLDFRRFYQGFAQRRHAPA